MADIILNRPNWLGSAERLVRKTVQVPADYSDYVTKVDACGNERKIVPSGSYLTTPYKGLLFNDVDITNGAREGSLVIGGYYIDAKLPKTVAAHAADLAAQGLHAIVEGATTRPDFGSVLPLAINYPNSVYLYPFGGTDYEIGASGYSLALSESKVSGVDYEINVSGTIPSIKLETKTGLGYDAAVTNIFVALIEIKVNNFDITKLKYCRHGGTLASVTADDIYTMNGKTYLINAFGVYDTDDSGTIGNKVVTPSNMNLIDIQYNGVTKVYKYTYNFGTLAV